LVTVWLLGSVVALARSLLRVFRFNRLLLANSENAPQDLQAEAERLASRLGLTTIAEVCTTSARISPMVWWTGGQVRVVIPTALLDQMKAAQWRWVLAHELAHVRRRDYMVRWLEWLVCVCFWWNPVVWWARHNLRATEKICCDALVVSGLNPKSGVYAKSLLTAIECLARPLLHPPAMASEINSGGYLEKRFKMIVSGTINTSRWLQACVLLCVTVVIPFGLAYAQEDDRDKRVVEDKQSSTAREDKRGTEYRAIKARIRADVEAGEITEEQGQAGLDAYRKSLGRGERGKDRRAEYRAIEERIRAAVEAGKMTREEAGEKTREEAGESKPAK